jgi:uncharacterized membrane protein
MKLRNYLSILVLIIFCILGGASFDEDGSVSSWVWIVAIMIALVFIVTFIVAWEQQKKQDKKDKLEKARAEESRKQKENEYNTWYENYTKQNGIPDKSIIVEPNDKTKVLLVHEKAKKIYICGETYNFSDIISCSFADNPKVIKGEIKAETKSNTGSTVGRAVVGDLIAGPTGAIIGGTTGKKTTTFYQGNDRTVHNFTVIININSISNPVIHIGTSNGNIVNEIIGVINVIISRK